jgi:hypothetical protein
LSYPEKRERLVSELLEIKSVEKNMTKITFEVTQGGNEGDMGRAGFTDEQPHFYLAGRFSCLMFTIQHNHELT